jgi:acetolactate synthase-1/2/3 large subunit
MVTSGPAATNLVTPLCDAYMDSVPMVAITGQVATTAIGTDAFQECDTVGITRSVTKHNELVMSAQDLPRIVAEAFHIATTGRPGPGPHRRPQGRPHRHDGLGVADALDLPATSRR